jgi:hypothetical protein
MFAAPAPDQSALCGARRSQQAPRLGTATYFDVLRPSPYFAIAHVPMVAKIATKIPDGIAVWYDGLLSDTKSGPQIAVTATATHIMLIAIEYQISCTRSSDVHLSGEASG